VLVWTALTSRKSFDRLPSLGHSRIGVACVRVCSQRLLLSRNQVSASDMWSSLLSLAGVVRVKYVEDSVSSSLPIRAAKVNPAALPALFYGHFRDINFDITACNNVLTIRCRGLYELYFIHSPDSTLLFAHSPRTPHQTCRSCVRLFASLVLAQACSNHAYLEHLSPSSTSDDGFESRHHETAPGRNARTTTTTTATISNR
jgi:hypothetical protein